MQKKKHTSINREIVSLTIASVTVSCLVFGSVTLIVTRQALTACIDSRSKVKAEKLNILLSDHLVNCDYPKVKQVINEGIQGSDIKMAWLADKNGIVIASNDENQIQLPIKDEYRNSKGFLSRSNSRGESICLLPDYGIIENVYVKVIPWILISFLFSSAIVYRISLRFIKTITVPVLNAVHAASSMAKGNFNINFSESGIEEIDTLYRAISHTADNLLELTNNLEKEKNELNHSREEIRNLSEFRERIIENASIWLKVLDKDSRVVVWNKAAEEISGYSKDEAIGNLHIWVLLYPEERYRDSIMQKTFGIIKKGDVIEDMITVIRAKDGTEKIISWYSKCLTTADGSPTGSVSMGIDITEKIKAEEILKQTQKMETIGVLAGGIAHDFNNILMGIVGTLSILEFKLSDDQPLTRESASKYISTIQNAAARAKDMVNQLLTLSRKQKLELTDVDISVAIKHIAEICRGSFDKSIIIVTPENPAPAYVRADLLQIEQVLLNLCVNASHAMTLMKPQGEKWGGTLLITLSHADDIKNPFNGEHTEGKYWKISVKDTGIGMNKSVMRKIFDPFYTTKEKGKGTGLGLSMAYNIIKSHNGFISVQSEPGQGSVFDIYLPAITGGVIHGPVTDDTGIEKGSGLILVVDDEAVNRDVARMMLEYCGYDVITASDGDEAIKIYNENAGEIKAVILDIVMPSMSGDEVCLKILKDHQEAVILVSSGFINDPRVKRSLNAGAKLFIPKPYTLKTLCKALLKVNGGAVS